MTGSSRFAGRCHCGNIRFVFETAKTPGQLGVRACDCSFCTRHGARTTTDSQGGASFIVRDAAKLNRYRFGLRTADFLVCAACTLARSCPKATRHTLPSTSTPSTGARLSRRRRRRHVTVTRPERSGSRVGKRNGLRYGVSRRMTAGLTERLTERVRETPAFGYISGCEIWWWRRGEPAG